jgi:hypothetical protein
MSSNKLECFAPSPTGPYYTHWRCTAPVLFNSFLFAKKKMAAPLSICESLKIRIKNRFVPGAGGGMKHCNG